MPISAAALAGVARVIVALLALAAALSVVLPVGDKSRALGEERVDRGAWTAVLKPAAARGQGLQELFGARFGEHVVIVSGASYDITKVKALTFNLRSRSWSDLAPAPLRWRVGAAFTATQDGVFVWGGFSNAELVPTGAEYDVATGSWRRISPAPLRTRGRSSAVWSGDEVLVWGGTRDPFSLGASKNGAAYAPAGRVWTRVPRAPIDGRFAHEAVWTGEEMIVWGGYPREYGGVARNFFADGAAFNPVSRTWREIAKAPLRGAEDAFALWTGKEMFVWNGSDAALYDPEADAWRRAAQAPLGPRGGHTGVWTGSNVLLWGYSPGGSDQASEEGASYDPVSDTWTRIPTGPLAERGGQAAVWTGESMFVWGGCCYGRNDNVFRDGAEYFPSKMDNGARVPRGGG